MCEEGVRWCAMGREVCVLLPQPVHGQCSEQRVEYLRRFALAVCAPSFLNLRDCGTTTQGTVYE